MRGWRATDEVYMSFRENGVLRRLDLISSQPCPGYASIAKSPLYPTLCIYSKGSDVWGSSAELVCAPLE